MPPSLGITLNIAIVVGLVMRRDSGAICSPSFVHLNDLKSFVDNGIFKIAVPPLQVFTS